MSFTYDTSTDVGKVRLLISDTVEATAHFSDEELETFLGMNDSSIYLAAASALEAWAATETGNFEREKIGDYEYGRGAVNKKLTLAKKYREVEAETPVFDIASMDLTAGSAITDEED